MTFPTGDPAPPKSGTDMGLDKILYLATAGLGVLILLLGFTPMSAQYNTGLSFYQGAFGWIPATYLIAGLIAALVLMPGTAKPGPLPAIVSVGATLPYLFMIFSVSGLGFGGIIVLILGILQTGVAVTAFLLDAGIVTPPAPKPYQAQHQQGGWNQQPVTGFPQGQYSQPVQPQSTQQPGQFRQPQPQPTQFMSHPGQFGQSGGQHAQPSQGQHQQGEGTPPSGFPAPPQG